MTTATTSDVHYEVAKTGGFPTADEFGRVCHALADVDEFGLQPLLQRIAGPLVDAFENEHDKREIEFTYADLGLLVAKADSLVYWAELTLRSARNLRKIAADVGDAIENGGRVDHEPQFGKYGGEYKPSPEALERWGLDEPKNGDDA